MSKIEEVSASSAAEQQEGVKTIPTVDFDQIAEHLQSGDPNKTVLLQGPDGKTRLFVNNDANCLPNLFTDGRSFDDLSVDSSKSIEFELQFRLHKDSVMSVARPGEALAPAVPAVMYHAHVWWFWTYQLGFKEDEGVMKAVFSLKSVGPQMNPNKELPRGALGENVPRTQMAPSVKNARLKVNDKTFKLITVLGAPDNSYVLNDFMPLEELKQQFSDNDPFLSLKVLIQVEKSYFDVESQAGLKEKETALVRPPPKNIEETLEKILKGERTAGSDYVLTFGDSSKNDSVEYFVHRQAMSASCPVLAEVIRNKVNPPGDQILVPSAEDRIIFPHLKPVDAPFFLSLFYLQKITLPHHGAYARIGRVYCMLVERPQILHLFKQWQKLAVQKLLEVKKTKNIETITDECVKFLIGIYSAPYGALPVAKRVAVSLFADQISIAEAQGKDMIAELRKMKQFDTYNLEKFLPGVVRLKLMVAAVKKEAVIG